MITAIDEVLETAVDLLRTGLQRFGPDLMSYLECSVQRRTGPTPSHGLSVPVAKSALILVPTAVCSACCRYHRE